MHFDLLPLGKLRIPCQTGGRTIRSIKFTQAISHAIFAVGSHRTPDMDSDRQHAAHLRLRLELDTASAGMLRALYVPWMGASPASACSLLDCPDQLESVVAWQKRADFGWWNRQAETARQSLKKQLLWSGYRPNPDSLKRKMRANPRSGRHPSWLAFLGVMLVRATLPGGAARTSRAEQIEGAPPRLTLCLGHTYRRVRYF